MIAVAYVSWGRWVADCPRAGCPNAEHFGRAENGHVGGLTGSSFRCAHCGVRCAATWPPNVDDINYLLSVRPVPASRNWQPGETLHDLLVENLMHGIVPMQGLASGGPLLEIVGERIVDRALVTASRPEIER